MKFHAHFMSETRGIWGCNWLVWIHATFSPCETFDKGQMTSSRQKKVSSRYFLFLVIAKMEADTKWVNKNYIQLDSVCIYLCGEKDIHRERQRDRGQAPYYGVLCVSQRTTIWGVSSLLALYWGSVFLGFTTALCCILQARCLSQLSLPTPQLVHACDGHIINMLLY